jgi:SAM-dependent methyltransferase
VKSKSPADQYWNQRPVTEPDLAKVNMQDTVQRDLELEFVFANLWRSARMVEIGCGNGYVSRQLRERVSFVDAFDYAENMIESARLAYGEANNRFLHDNVLDPKSLQPPYDIALCVRVLMNLRNFEEQKAAICNIAGMLRRGGRLILIEGFRDGFDVLTGFRQSIGLPAVIPASHNFHSSLAEMIPVISEQFLIERTWHTGIYDFLTRIVFPQLVGAENATKPGEFHARIEPIARAYDGPDMAQFARVHGFALTRR